MRLIAVLALQVSVPKHAICRFPLACYKCWLSGHCGLNFSQQQFLFKTSSADVVWIYSSHTPLYHRDSTCQREGVEISVLTFSQKLWAMPQNIGEVVALKFHLCMWWSGIPTVTSVMLLYQPLVALMPMSDRNLSVLASTLSLAE